MSEASRSPLYVGMAAVAVVAGLVMARSWLRPVHEDPPPIQKKSRVLETGGPIPPSSLSSAPAEAVDGPSPVDLLPWIDTDLDRVQGAWTFEGRSLWSPSAAWARLQVPCAPPVEYDLNIRATRRGGGNSFNVVLIVRGAPCMVVLDGHDGRTNGLEMIDGKNFISNQTTSQGVCLPPDKPVALQYSVRRGGVSVFADGKKMVEWWGDASRLSVYENWRLPDTRTLGLAASETVFEIHALSLTPISGVPGRLR